MSKWNRQKNEAVVLPDDMLAEIERLGEDRRKLEYWAASEGLEFARLMLKDAADTEALFEKWYLRLQEFVAEHRAADPLPDDTALSSFDRAIRRVLEPKIKNQEILPQQVRYRVPILTAPHLALSLVVEEWSAKYTNPIFMTNEELQEWWTIYDEHEDAPWWNFYYEWCATANPIADEFWMKHSTYSPPAGTTPVLVTWGSSVGSLAGSWTAELWCIDADGSEAFVGDLGLMVS